ncbi:MAG: TonB-dependent receptor [Cytophagaceae bacterium]|nr:TonB-dependent receptor [Cytophagaceae bacterium]
MLKKLLLSFTMFLGMLGTAWAQDRVVSGRVTGSDDNSAVPGASVVLKGTTQGTTTDANGGYRLSVSDGATLVFSAVGYAQQELLVGARSTLDVALIQNANQLDEFVVVGYGTQRRTSVTGAITNISARSIQNIPLANLGNTLQGFAPGVQITNQNGRPGAPAFIRIRGVGSINAGSDPLYVVDGVPLNPDAYGAINPNAIESISILKDAASVAIFGSRGSNGVILVTTRRPAPTEGPRVDVNVRYGYSEKTPDNFRMMNVDEKLRYEYALGYANSYVSDYLKTKNISGIAAATEADLQPIWTQLRDQSVDWFDILLRKGKQHTENVSVSGGSEKLSYYFGFQNYGEEGINKGSFYKRQTGTLSLEFRPYSWLKVGQSTNVSFRRESLLRDRNNAQSPFRAVYTYNPYEPERNPDESFNLTHQGFSISEAIENNPETTRTLNGLATTYVEVSPVKNLTLRSNLGVNYIDYARESYIKPGSILDQYVGDPNAKGSKTDNGSGTFNYIWTNTAQYSLNLATVHNLRLLVGSEFTKNSFKSYSLGSKGFPSNLVNTQDNASTPLTATTARSDWSLYSLFSRLNYDYDQKYLLEVSFRRDGSSRFGRNNRYGNFWAVGAGWNLNREAFLENASFINNLKIRAAVGTSGNFNIGNYASLGLYRFGSYGLTSASLPSQLENPDLTWERSLSYNLGTEFTLFNRLRGVVEFYNRDTKDLLLNVPLSNTTGFNSRLENVGSMRNRGVEAELGYDIIKARQARGFNWDFRVNFTFNKNQITDLFNDKDIPNGVTRYVEGQPTEVFFLNRSAGVDPANGDPLYLTAKGEVTNKFSSGDAATLEGKAPDPRYYGSVFNTFSFAGFRLSAQVYYSGGNYILNSMWSTLVSDGSNRASAQAAYALDYWKASGDNTPNPRPTNVIYTTDRFLEKGDFIRLRNVSLGYDLPKSLLGKLRLQEASVYVQGQNLFYYAPNYHGDPEVGFGSGEGGGNATRGGVLSLFSFPTTRTVTVGVNVSF